MNESRVESSPRKLAANRVQLKASGVLQPQLKTNRKDQHNSFQTENVELRASTCMLFADGKCGINLWLQLDLYVPYLIRLSVSGTLKSSLIPEFEFASVLPSPLCRVLFCSRHSVFLIFQHSILLGPEPCLIAQEVLFTFKRCTTSSLLDLLLTLHHLFTCRPAVKRTYKHSLIVLILHVKLDEYLDRCILSFHNQGMQGLRHCELRLAGTELGWPYETPAGRLLHS